MLTGVQYSSVQASGFPGVESSTAVRGWLMASKSTDSEEIGKARKPRPDFPLFPHRSGRWCKKVRGQFAYFGKVSDDPQGERALQLWNDQKDALLAGRKPRQSTGGLTVEDLGFKYLDSKQKLVDTGELSPRSLENYRKNCAKISKVFGRSREVSDLTPEDFDQLRAALGKDVGPVTLRNEVRHARMLFKYAYEQGLIPVPMRFGQHFKIPAKRILKRERRQSGKKLFDADELRALIDAAPVVLRAMILLAINAGLGNTDCAELQMTDMDLETGWLDYPRRKTEVDRRAPLWPETVQAIRDAIAKRPLPVSEADADCVFLTKFGQRWVRIGEGGGPTDSVSTEFTKLVRSPICPKCGTLNRVNRGASTGACRACGWKPEEDAEEWQRMRPRGFYAIRHGFQTIGEQSRDFAAVRCIMGHSDGSMSAEYREEIGDDRLLDVTDTVRHWLWPEAKPSRRKSLTRRA